MTEASNSSNLQPGVRPNAKGELLPAERGFTLVELMVVVAIIALLASITIPNYVHSRAQAAVAQSEANMKQIATALELYHTDYLQYPAGSGATVGPALFTPPQGAAADAGVAGGGNNYMNATPTSAATRKPYLYTLVAATGPTTESYTIDDLGPYDPSTLSSVPLLGGTANCTACTELHYSPEAGVYGS
jgi:type II secretion system protein G